jgi:hypothetical protein
MCLNYTLQKNHNDIPQDILHQKIGWKIFYLKENELCFEHFIHGFMNNRKVPTNRWLFSSKIRRINTSRGLNKYIPCFHIYLKHPGELNENRFLSNFYKIVQVRYKWPVAYGMQEDLRSPVVIARMLYVPDTLESKNKELKK